MKTIGHHTTSGEGDLFEVRDKAPFISSGGPMDWMGKGYYFWDNDDEAAHYWGKSHYKNNYYIFKSELELNSIDFFDLVGNREHMIFMTKAFQRFSKFKKPEERWSLRKMFDLLRDLNTKPNTLGIFPYKVARCIDCINNGGNKVLIVE